MKQKRSVDQIGRMKRRIYPFNTLRLMLLFDSRLNKIPGEVWSVEMMDRRLQQGTGRCNNKSKLLFLFALLSSLVVLQYRFGLGTAIQSFKSVYAGPRQGGVLQIAPAIPPAQNNASSNDKNLQLISPQPPPSSSTLNASLNVINPTNAESQKAAETAVISNGANSSAMIPQTNATLCPVVPPVLVGPIKVWFDYPTMEKLEELYPYLEPGGHGKPKDCRSRHRVAIVIPFRDRERQLRAFLHNLHSLLTKQQLDYAIFVVEPIANETFNRAKLMNIGFAEATKLYDWQCFIFHDVDLLPEDDRNLYTCPEQPRHMSVAIDKFRYRLPYADLFGGISALTKEQFIKINGFPNDYWGWGGEDDDIATRVKVNGFKISRYPVNIARYKMIKHTTEKTNPVNKCRYKLLSKTKRRMGSDGLKSLSYTVVEKTLGKLYTRVVVDLKESESRQKLKEEKLGC